MRPVIALIFGLLIGGAIFLYLSTPGRTFRIQNPTEIAGWDGERRAFRQVSTVVTTGDGKKYTYEITLFGPARQILEPWLDLDFGGTQMEMQPIGSYPVKVPEGSRVAWWNGEAWDFSTDEFPVLEGLKERLSREPRLSLFDALADQFPEREPQIEALRRGAGEEE